LETRAARRRRGHFPDMVRRALTLCLLGAIAGCASVPPEPPQAPEAALPEPEPLPAPQEQDEAVPEPPPPPLEIIMPEETSAPFRPRAAIVLSNRSPAFQNVAEELSSRLDELLLYNLADKSLSPEDAFAGIAESGVSFVVAIGLRAAEAATAHSTIPVIYCQVFNFGPPDDPPIPVKGISSIPPLDLQLESWKKVDPGLQRIGAILGEGHDELIAEAERATMRNGVSLHHRIAKSDRETLYMFRRLAPGIDGFWLFPDSRILSLPVLEKMISIAAQHGVRIAVFNDAMLDLGVALSTTSVDADIAEKILFVAEQIAAGAADSVPDLTPLDDLYIRTSESRKVVESVASDGADAARTRL